MFELFYTLLEGFMLCPRDELLWGHTWATANGAVNTEIHTIKMYVVRHLRICGFGSVPLALLSLSSSRARSTWLAAIALNFTTLALSAGKRLPASPLLRRPFLVVAVVPVWL